MVDYSQTHSQRLRANRVGGELSNMILGRPQFTPNPLAVQFTTNVSGVAGSGVGGGGGGGGGVTGTGTVGHHTRWATTASLQDSVMFEDAGAISIQGAKPLDFTRQNLPAAPATGYLRLFANTNPQLFYSLDPTSNLHGPFLGPGHIWVGGQSLGSASSTLTATWTPSTFTVAGYVKRYRIIASIVGLNQPDVISFQLNGDTSFSYTYTEYANFSLIFQGTGTNSVNVDDDTSAYPRQVIMELDDVIGDNFNQTSFMLTTVSMKPSVFSAFPGLEIMLGYYNRTSNITSIKFLLGNAATNFNAGSRVDVYAMRGQSG